MKPSQARHLNDDRHDNRVENLCWGTDAENKADAKRNGVGSQGERNGRAILTRQMVMEIRKTRGKLTQDELAAKYGVTQTTISAIQLRKLWRDES